MDARAANLAVRFVLELVVLAGLALWGFNATSDLLVRIVLGLGVPAGIMAVWATYVSPRAPRRLPDPTRLAVEGVIFGAGVLAFILAGLPILGVLLGVMAAASLWLMVSWGQRGL